MKSSSALPSRRRPALRALVAFVAVLATGACAQQVQRGPAAEVAAMLSVERFLQASNARDYEAMARLFGDSAGPVADTGGAFGCAFKRIGSWIGLGDRCIRREDVELRMAALAEILRHRDYRIVSERVQPGRSQLTNRLGVDITRENGNVVRDVAFVVVRTSGGTWLVQEIDVLRMTG